MAKILPFPKRNTAFRPLIDVECDCPDCRQFFAGLDEPLPPIYVTTLPLSAIIELIAKGELPI